MITAKICIDCPVALQKGLRKMAGRVSLRFILHGVCCKCVGREKMLGLHLMAWSFHYSTLFCLSLPCKALITTLWPLVSNTGLYQRIQESSQSWRKYTSDKELRQQLQGAFPNSQPSHLPPSKGPDCWQQCTLLHTVPALLINWNDGWVWVDGGIWAEISGEVP